LNLFNLQIIDVWLVFSLQAFLTPLLVAARFSSEELVRCLLLAGADIDTRTKVLHLLMTVHPTRRLC